MSTSPPPPSPPPPHPPPLPPPPPLDTLLTTPLFAGGLGLASLGYLAALSRRLLLRSSSLLRRRLLVNLEITKSDPSYPMLLAWLSLPRPAPGLAATLTRIHDL